MEKRQFKTSVSIIKRIWKDYLSRYKKTYFFVILLMIISQVSVLSAPLISQSILDDHLGGVANVTWYEVDVKDSHTVSFNHSYYQQEQHFEEGMVKGSPLTIVADEKTYYYFEGELPDKAITHQKVEGESLILTLEDGEEHIIMGLQSLTKKELQGFYQPSYKILFLLIGLLIAVTFVSIVVGHFQNLIMRSVNVRIVRDARKDAAVKLQQLPMVYFDQEPSGKMANRILYDVNGIVQLIDTIFNIALHAILTLIIVYVGMFLAEWKIAFFTLGLLPLLVLWSSYFMRRMRHSAREVNELNSRVADTLNRLINAVPLLQIFNYGDPACHKFNHISKEYMDEQLDEVKIHMSIGGNLLELVLSLLIATLVLFFGFGGINVFGFAITAGTIYAFIHYIPEVIEPFHHFFEEVEHLEHGFARSERFFKLMDVEGEVPMGEVIPRFKGYIEVKDLWFKYVDGEDYVLKGCNLKINAGDTVGIVGPSRSGKSTFTNLLMRFYDFDHNDRGQILIDGEDITKYTKHAYREHFGMIHQEAVLFDGTIASNVRYGKEEASDEEVIQVLKQIGADFLLTKFEKGIHQEVNHDGRNLSKGEVQLIAIARVILHDPAILIMDEPTEYLDSDTEALVHQAIRVVSEGRTVIIIEHNLLAVRDCDHIILLEDGVKKEEGTHEELIKQRGRYAQMYRSQISL